MTIVSIIEDGHGRITGAMVGTPDAPNEILLDADDVCPRSELPSRASALCSKYGLVPSSLMQQALAAATGAGLPSTPTPPTP